METTRMGTLRKEEMSGAMGYGYDVDDRCDQCEGEGERDACGKSDSWRQNQ
ncbi:ubiquitin carboxyl-terminal hydrolase [Sesbania bispinosa]|nr:ubiquitin carboxyl-terminal hydrolase [Sesbania bispinosa]